MKYLSLFSGYGGFELGIQKAYALSETKRKQHGRDKNDMSSNGSECMAPECIGFSEIDKYAIQTYQQHFKDHKNYGDITKIEPSELPDFDLLVGGFPCQAFSIAGKRLGFEDTRGTLIYDVFRIIKEKHPKYVLLENVKGLLSHDSGRTFKTIITSLAELGYAVEWQVLNAKNFGVPQNRERVFIIGHLGGFGGRQVFPIGETNPKALQYVGSLGNTKKWNDSEKDLSRNSSQGERVYDPVGVSACLSAQGGGQGAKTGLYVSHVDRSKGEYKLKETERAGCLTSTMYKGIDASGRTGVISRTIRSGGRGTLDAKHNWDIINDGVKIRRLTPTECERLMGLPDGWTSEGTEGKISDTQRYKLCGNGVVVNVVEKIIKKLYI